MNIVPMTIRAFGATLLPLVLFFAPHIVCRAAEADDIGDFKRAIEALREENRALNRRLESLEGKRDVPAPSAPSAAERAAPAKPGADDVGRTEQLEQRIKDLERTKSAQEDAVRSIIRSSVATLGPKINEAAALGGVIGTTFGRSKDFAGAKTSTLGFSSLDFEFDVSMSEWAMGHIKLDYADGSAVQFPTTTGTQAGVDRINLDTAFITLGNQQKFAPLLSIGRMVLPFGTSTGHPVTDALSVGSALTVDAFEMKHNMLGLNIGFPTRRLGPRVPPVFASPVRPTVIYPFVSEVGRRLGYDPPSARVKPPAAIVLDPEPPPYSAGIYTYEGKTPGGFARHTGATFGYRVKSNCGRRYEELTGIGLCPWSTDASLSYNRSVFNTQFLETQYEPFLNSIGRVPGFAASVRSALGPFSVVTEWSSATKFARFVDDRNVRVRIKPAAWQVSLGYQLGWNPWIKEIGQQGSYVSIGYSRSHDLAGVTEMVNTKLTRVGFVPKQRLLLTFGEWVVDGVRFAVEYSRNWDYSPSEGGTGRATNGIGANLVYAW